MSLPDKFIVFLGRTFSGHNHDYLMLKQEFPPELDWFIELLSRLPESSEQFAWLNRTHREL